MLKKKRRYLQIALVFCVFFFPLVSWAEEGEAPAGVTQGVPAELVKAGAVQGLSASDWKKLEAGEIVILKEMDRKENKAFIQSALIFQKPIEEVHGLLTRTERQEEYLPHLDRAILIKREGNRDNIEFLLHFSFIDIRYQVKHYYGEPGEYRMSWALNPDFKNDLAQLEGYWKFYRLDKSRTLARYGTLVKVGRLIPKFIEDALSRKDIPKSLGQLKKWVESGGTWTKPEYKQK
jgi:hypothetical protein